MIARALSSVGSEHLVYTQRVGGSNPSAPTKGRQNSLPFFISCQPLLSPKIRTKGSGFVTRSRGTAFQVIPQRPQKEDKIVFLFLFQPTSPFLKNSNEGERVRNVFTRNKVPSNPSAPTEGRQKLSPFSISRNLPCI